MKTLVCTKSGEFNYEESEMPQLQKDQAIIKIKRIGICGTDLPAFEIACMKKGLVNPTIYFTRRVQFDEVKDKFASWLKPETSVIKATVELN